MPMQPPHGALVASPGGVCYGARSPGESFQVNKDHVRFLISGILFGFLVGYIVAYGIYEPRVKEVADAPPEAGNLGMTGASIGPSGGGGGMAPAGDPQGGPPAGDATMAMVLKEISDLKQRLEKDPKDVDALTHLTLCVFSRDRI